MPRGRRVELIRIAAAGSVLAAAGLFGVREAVPVAVVTGLLFVANGGVVPLYEATLAQLLNTRHGVDPARYGRVRVWGSIGFMAAVTAFGALLERFGIAVFPGFVLAMNLLLFAAALRLPATRDDLGVGAAQGIHPQRIPGLRDDGQRQQREGEVDRQPQPARRSTGGGRARRDDLDGDGFGHGR